MIQQARRPVNLGNSQSEGISPSWRSPVRTPPVVALPLAYPNGE
jgi:hypothetical protein